MTENGQNRRGTAQAMCVASGGLRRSNDPVQADPAFAVFPATLHFASSGGSLTLRGGNAYDAELAEYLPRAESAVHAGLRRRAAGYDDGGFGQWPGRRAIVRAGDRGAR